MTTQLSMFGDNKEIKAKKQDTTAVQDNLRRELYQLRQEKSVLLSSKNPNPKQVTACLSRIKTIESIFRQKRWDINNYGPLFEGL